MAKSPIGFIQPKRRLTRQRSGFSVSGTRTGSECKILPTNRIKVTTKRFELSKKFDDVIFTKLFDEEIGIFGMGGYFKANKQLSVFLEIDLINKKSSIKKAQKRIVLAANHWTRIGVDIEHKIVNMTDKFSISTSIMFVNSGGNYGLEFYGLCAGVVKYYADKPEYKKTYFEKTELYKPDIYYLDNVDFYYDKTVVKELSPGFLVCKSCNRCARFLPIDLSNEKNALGFSNHCKKKAPCSHTAFSRYLIENPKNISLLPENLKKSIVIYNKNQYIRTYFGFQLECRSCKKFVVNAPLNPLRNKAQHHEDSARRRAFERLIIELTGNDVVKNFRFINGIEFQEYIWKRFSKKCFGCGKEIKKIIDMDIDHTLPLAYLWPLNNSATALCKTCNSQKHELFPSEFRLYNKKKLRKLSSLTGIPFKVLNSKERIVNMTVAKLLKQKVVWFFDDFLARKDYQKIKRGKKVADLIYKALNKVLTTVNLDLVMEYEKKTSKVPTTITLE
jgi:hypothetical protein